MNKLNKIAARLFYSQLHTAKFTNQATETEIEATWLLRKEEGGYSSYIELAQKIMTLVEEKD